MRLASPARMIAPSIFASSERRCGLKAASRRNPPEQMLSTSGPSPTTMRAPIPACKIRSRPSRSGRPGATAASASSIAMLRRGPTVWGYTPLPASTSGTRARLGPPGLVMPVSLWVAADHLREDDGVGDGCRSKRREARGRVGRGVWQHDATETQTRCFRESAWRLADLSQLTAEPDLCARHDIVGQSSVRERRHNGERDREIGTPPGDARATDGEREHVIARDREAGMALEHRQQEGEPPDVETLGRPTRDREVGLHRQRLDLDEKGAMTV